MPKVSFSRMKALLKTINESILFVFFSNFKSIVSPVIWLLKLNMIGFLDLLNDKSLVLLIFIN